MDRFDAKRRSVVPVRWVAWPKPRRMCGGSSQIPRESGGFLAVTSYMSFQSPDKISQAFRLISPIDLWSELEIQLDNPKKDLKKQLSLIVDRRNKIVHEGDLSPTFPRRPWTISTGDALQAREFIEHLGHNILLIAECDGSS